MVINQLILIKKEDCKITRRGIEILSNENLVRIGNMMTIRYEGNHEYNGYPLDHPRYGGIHALEKHFKYIVLAGDGEQFYVLGPEQGLVFSPHTYVGKHHGLKLYQEYAKTDKKDPAVIVLKDIKGL